MRLRRLALCLLLYVFLDFSNPMIPGAVSFDPEECTDGIGTARGAGAWAVKLVAPLPVRSVEALEQQPPARPGRRAASVVSELHPWLAQVRRAQAAPADPASTSEDH